MVDERAVAAVREQQGVIGKVAFSHVNVSVSKKDINI